MTYLYGDSSRSSITIDYIDFLKHALDLMVELMVAEQRVAGNATRAVALEERAGEKLEAIAAVGDRVRETLAAACGDPEDSPASRCANAIERAATAEVQTHVRAVNEEVERARAELESARRAELASCANSLEQLVQRYDLPETATELAIVPVEGGGYRVKRNDKTPYGLELEIAIEVPEGNRLATAIRASELGLDRELEVPSGAGLTRKQIRKLPRKPAKLYLHRATITRSASRLMLAAAPEGGSGLELIVDRDGRSVEVSPVDVAGVESSFAAAGADLVAILEFDDLLREAIAALPRSGARLGTITVDGEPFASWERPSEIAERLVAVIAPVVVEISERSSSPTELVLRRSLESGRREEIFVPKAELAAKLAQLPADSRRLFGPLGLGNPSTQLRTGPSTELATPGAAASTSLEVELIVEAASKDDQEDEVFQRRDDEDADGWPDSDSIPEPVRGDTTATGGPGNEVRARGDEDGEAPPDSTMELDLPGASAPPPIPKPMPADDSGPVIIP
jgi:hypothetical protein